MLKNYFFLLFIFCSSQHGIGQKNIVVTFSSSDSNTTLLKQKNIEITKLIYYISNIELLQEDNKSVYISKQSYLIDNAINEETVLGLSVQEGLSYSHIRFQLGVDSLTNVGGALGGDLDPIHGMYWTWQNGYINFKLEGSSPLCPSRNHKFTYHLGGYQGIHSSITVVLPILNDDIHIVLYLDQVCKKINFVENHSIMSPSIISKMMMESVGKSFKSVL